MRLHTTSWKGFRECNFCRATVVRCFTSTLADQPRLPRSRYDTQAYGVGRHPRVPQARWFSAQFLGRSDVEPQTAEVEAIAVTTDLASADKLSSSVPQSQPLPWYLQGSAQQRLSRPLLPREQLPELPPDPPLLLAPLLQHVSVELGLDHLSLIDLRELEPPPALGANVLMLIGTARSEQHLHVSADRLCRWLRSNHRLRPYADGLLGRNELKLKMRRKTRRAKLLGGMSGSAGGKVDDDGKTGWVCVNVGLVQPNDVQKLKVREVEGIVGFGSQVEGVRIVVQMFTEGRRSEMDLESLWGGILRRNARERVVSQKSQAGDVADDEGAIASPTQGPSEANRLSYLATPSTMLGPSGQVRRLHTSSRLGFTEVVSPIRINIPSDIKVAVPRPENTVVERQNPALTHTFDLSRSNGHQDTLRYRVRSWIGKDLSADEKALDLLRSLLRHIRRLHPSKALQLLGKGAQDYTSTPFLQSFYQIFPPFPTAKHWHCRVLLQCYALKLGHQGYQNRDLRSLLRKMQLTGVGVLRNTLLTMLQTILSPNQLIVNGGVIRQCHSTPSHLDKELAMSVLEDMGHRGLNIITEDIFVLLHEAVGFPEPIRALTPSKDTVLRGAFTELSSNRVASDQKRQEVTGRHTQLNILMDHHSIIFTNDGRKIRLLQVFANQGNWKAFWDFWGLPARQLRPRSAALYAFMFQTIARTKHPAMCTETLRTRVPEMSLETPRVELDDAVALEIMHCLKWAHPSVEEEAHAPQPVEGEWVRLWRRCEAGLESSSAKDLSSVESEELM